MLKSVIKKEILENIVTFRFFSLTLVVAMVMAVSLVVMYGDYQTRLENYNLLRPAPSSADILLPPNPLSLFVRGLDANMGRLVEVYRLGINPGQQSANRLFALFTTPDLLFIVRTLLALAALLFSYDAISEERENGTLRLYLACGGKKITLLFGKVIGRFLLVFAPFALLYILLALISLCLPGVALSLGDLGRLAFLLPAVALYLLVFICLGVFISIAVASGAVAMPVSFGVWTVFVFVIPNLGFDMAKAMQSLPGSDQVEMSNRLQKIQAIYETIQHSEKMGQDHWKGSELTERIREINSRVYDEYQPRLQALIELTKGLVRLSPYGSFTYLATDLANTGLLEENRLKMEVYRYYQRNYRAIAEGSHGDHENFHFRPAGLVEILGAVSYEIGVLLLYVFIFLGLAINRFLNYQV